MTYIKEAVGLAPLNSYPIILSSSGIAINGACIRSDRGSSQSNIINHRTPSNTTSITSGDKWG